MNKAILILAILAFSLAPNALSSPVKGSEDKDRELISINLGTLFGGLFGGTKNTTTPSNSTSSNNSTATIPVTNNTNTTAPPATNDTSSNNNTATPPFTNNTSSAPVANNTSSNNSTTTIPAANNTNSSNNTSNTPATNNTSSNNNTTTIPVTNNTNTTIPPASNNTNTTTPTTPVTNTTTPTAPVTNSTNTTTPVTPPAPVKYAKNDVNMATFATDCLNVHNVERKKVGLGNVIWSTDLAKSAQAWAENMAKNGFRHSGKTGENIASTSYSTSTLGRLLGMWVHEQAHYIVGCKYPKCSTTSAEVGHYTQMVWHSTTQVGCGFAPGYNRGYNYLCCQYYKAGNIVGQYVY